MKNITTGLLLLICISLFGQEVKVSGILQDSDNLPMAYAAVTFEGLDNTEFKQVYTEGDGSFEVEILPGKYDIIFQPVAGGITERVETITAARNLGVIVISNTVQLGATTAVGERPLYRLELDKRVYDMERDPSVRGATLSDALNNVPSVTVDGDGTVSLRGSENITVLIDGKQSAMTGITNVADALKNIQADAVQRVEVITNPSARYDASGSGGIINIIMKRGSNQGFNGSINANIGVPLQTGLSTSLNYRTQKWNFFVSPYIRYDKPRGSSNYTNRFFSSMGPDTIETQNGERIRERLNLGTGLGFEHYIGEKNTLSASMSMRRSSGENVNTLNYHNYAGSTLYGRSVRVDTEDDTNRDIEASLGFKHAFNKEGHEFNFISSGSYSHEDEISDIYERVLLGSGLEKSDLASNYEQQRRYLLQADYVFPHGEGARFELGYKGNFETNVNDFAVRQMNLDGNYILNPLFTDRVDFDQDIQALYSQYGNKMGKFSYLLGLRMENSAIRLLSANANEGRGDYNSRNYTHFFPSATVNYTFDEAERNQVQFSYSKRIRRPWSRWLSPFSNFSDDRNTFRGNPELNPVITNAFELSYLTQIGKTSLTPSLYYQKSTDDMTVFRRPANYNGNTIFISQPVNAGDEMRYGAELVASTQFASWWRLFGNLNLYGYENTGSYYDELSNRTYDLSGKGFSWFARLTNNFKLPSNIDFQLNGFYRAGQENAQSKRKPMYMVNLALSKDIMGGDGTLSLNARDIFETMRRRVENFGPGYTSDLDMQWRGRQITLNFTYRINQQKKRDRGERGQGMEENGEGQEF
ncbi:MAG: TonB-dependent receptor [Flavobacteriaceae bacterium]|nr:TonB-dependent receptor [Flavobacteriaceae bacterium]